MVLLFVSHFNHKTWC